MEEWRLIDEAPNYLVSDRGRVQNRFTKRILKPGLGDYYYPMVVLSNEGVRRTRYIHVLVAKAFVYGYFNGAEVNHIDGNKLNNCASNLEWCTHEENIKHASQLGLLGRPIKIVETGEIFLNAAQCAAVINGYPANIYHCLTGKRKKHRGFSFEYLE